MDTMETIESLIRWIGGLAALHLNPDGPRAFREPVVAIRPGGIELRWCKIKVLNVRRVIHGRVNRVKLAVLRPKIDNAVRPDGRFGSHCTDRPDGGEFPPQRSIRVEGIQVSVV